MHHSFIHSCTFSFSSFEGFLIVLSFVQMLTFIEYNTSIVSDQEKGKKYCQVLDVYFNLGIPLELYLLMYMCLKIGIVYQMRYG